MSTGVSGELRFMHIVVFTKDTAIFAFARDERTKATELFLIIGDGEKIYRRNGVRNRWDMLEQERFASTLQAVCRAVSEGIAVLKINGTSDSIMDRNKYKEAIMFTQTARTTIAAMLIVSITSLSVPAGIAHAAAEPSRLHATTTMAAANPAGYQAVSVAAKYLTASTKTLTAEEMAALKKIFGADVGKVVTGDAWTTTTEPPSSGHTVSYYDTNGNYLGKKVVKDSNNGSHSETYYDKNGTKIDTTANQDFVPPVRPASTETNIAVWTKYYKDYAAYVAKLTDATAKQNALTALSNDILSLSQTHPELISAAAMNDVMSTLTNELKEKFRNENYAIDLTKAQGNIVDAALNFIKSGAFKNMDDATKAGVTWNFTLLAVELSWSSKNNNQNSSLYPKIGQFFKTMLENGSTNSKAQTFNHLIYLYTMDSWVSKERNTGVANQILKAALDITGGITGLATTWAGSVNNAALSADERANIANALGEVIWQHEALNAVSTGKISDADLTKMSTNITTFLTGVNNGSLKISAGMRGGLIHSIGCAISVLIYENKYSSDNAQALGNALVTLAKDTLLLSSDKGGTVSLQATVINVLTNIMAGAKGAKLDTLAQQCATVLLDSSFDSAAFLAKAADTMKTTTNADYGSWLGTAMSNLAAINLEKNTGKITAANINTIVGTIKTWLADANHLKNMRCMQWQKELYGALANLLKNVYASGSALGADAGLQNNIVSIFSTIAGLEDSAVKEAAGKDLAGLVTALRTNGFKDLSCKLEMLSCTNSASLMTKAWNYYTAKDYASAILFANECISRYGATALQQQASLKGFAAAGKESTYWALNDVGTAHFILGEIYKAQGNKDKARTEYNTVIKNLKYAQCYDTKGWWWKVAEAATKSLNSL